MADRPTARAILGSLVVFGLSCAAFATSVRFVSLPPAWYTFEFCQYAEIGRNLATEGTYDTRLIEPMALAYVDVHRIGPPGPPGSRWPVVNRYPWPCAVIAGLMAVFGVGETVAAWSNGLAAGGLAVLAYALARRWYGPRWAAPAAILVVANPSCYGEFVLLGTPDVWFALIFGLELLAWCRLTEGAASGTPGRVGLAATTGVLAGLAFLTRFNVVAFLAPQVAVLLARRRWREAAALGATAAIVASPMVVYNVRHFGRPYVGVYSAWNLLDDIGAYRVEPWLYYRVPDVAGTLSAHFGGFLAKFATNLATVVTIRTWSLWRLDFIVPLAIVGLATGRRGDGDASRRFLAWGAGLFGFQLVLFSALRLELEDPLSPHHGRYFYWFAVPCILLGIGTLRRLAGRSRRWQVLTALVIVGQLVVFGRGWSRWVRPGEDARTNLGRDPIRKAIRSFVSPGQVIASNQPQVTAWFCERNSVSLPADPVELARLNRESPTPIAYLLLDVNFNSIDLDPRWTTFVRPDPSGASAWERAVLAGYEYVLPPDRTHPLLYVLLRRRDVAPSRLERTMMKAAGPG